jgi:hypothetical protein
LRKVSHRERVKTALEKTADGKKGENKRRETGEDRKTSDDEK